MLTVNSREEDYEKDGLVFVCPICQLTFDVRCNRGLAQSNHYRKHNIDTKKLSRRQLYDEDFLFRYVRGMHRWGTLWGVLYRKLDRWWEM